MKLVNGGVRYWGEYGEDKGEIWEIRDIGGNCIVLKLVDRKNK